MVAFPSTNNIITAAKGYSISNIYQTGSCKIFIVVGAGSESEGLFYLIIA